MRDNPTAGGVDPSAATNLVGIAIMRKLFVLIGIVGFTFGACEKPTETTPPPGDSASGGGAEGGAATAADTAGAEGGAAEGGAAEGGAEGGATTEPGAPGVAWAQKTFKQRQEWMGIEVLPKMKKVFQDHDATGFAQFKCQTCHGKDMNEKKFKMPNDGIYPLNPTDPVKGAKEYDEKMTKFMVDVVTPQMAALLDEKVMSKDNPNGFGCLRCHPSE